MNNKTLIFAATVYLTLREIWKFTELCHSSQLTPYGDTYRDANWLKLCLFPWGIKPESTLTYHQSEYLAFNWHQSHITARAKILIPRMDFEMYASRITALSPRNQWVNDMLNPYKINRKHTWHQVISFWTVEMETGNSFEFMGPKSVTSNKSTWIQRVQLLH